jgi:NADP oxidoreductase coenzyme F420-dependent
VISNSRGPETLKAVVEMLGDGVSAGTVEEAPAAAVVVLAVPWGNVRDAMKGLEWNGQVVIVFLSGDDVDPKSEVIALFEERRLRRDRPGQPRLRRCHATGTWPARRRQPDPSMTSPSGGRGRWPGPQSVLKLP